MNTQKQRIMNMMIADSDEYDIYGLIGSISSDDDCDIAANLLYFDLNDVELCNFFNKAGEFMVNCINLEKFDEYHNFHRTFNHIKFNMNEILRTRLGTQEDELEVSIPDFSGNTHTYKLNLPEMTISHMNMSYILSYEADTKAIEYLFTTDPSIRLRCKSSSSSNFIYVSRVSTPIHTFVLRKI